MTTATAPDAGIRVGGSRLSASVRGLATSRETGVLLALALLLGAAAVFGPQLLLGPDSMRDLLLTPAILVILAVGQTLVLATRNIDLSVGSVLGLTAWLTGQLFVAFPTMPIVGVFLAAMAMGGILGLVNGVLVTAAKAPALVITLGTLYAYRGINVMWADSRMVNASDMPREFLSFGIGSFAGVPHLTVIALVVLLAVGWYLRSRPRGREFYAIGSDPDAARLYGLSVSHRVTTAFVVSGALAGLTGALHAARYGTIHSQAGTGLEIMAVAAAVVGGVAIFGGRGSVWGAAVGAVLLITINRALPVFGVPEFWQQAVVGLLILGAIALDRLLERSRSRSLAQSRERNHG